MLLSTGFLGAEDMTRTNLHGKWKLGQSTFTQRPSGIIILGLLDQLDLQTLQLSEGTVGCLGII